MGEIEILWICMKVKEVFMGTCGLRLRGVVKSLKEAT
jgi:hypothetical protein